MASASGDGRHIIFDATYEDLERNLTRKKACGFSATVATLAGGSLSVPNNAQTAALTVTTAAAKDYNSDSLSAAAATFTCPRTGLYLFDGQASFATGVAGLREVNILNSTTGVIIANQSVNGAADVAVSNSYAVQVACLVKCAVGDVIQLRLFQNSGGALVASAVRFAGVYMGQTGGIGGTSL